MDIDDLFDFNDDLMNIEASQAGENLQLNMKTVH